MKQNNTPVILVVEDELSLAEAIAEHIRASEMEAHVFSKSEDALAFAEQHPVSLVLLDINLPDMDGFSVLNRLKSLHLAPPVIFITGNASVGSKIKGLDLGGDDYVTKPFSYQELMARIRAVLRRMEENRKKSARWGDGDLKAPFDFCDATIHPEKLEIEFKNGEKVKVRAKECQIMQILKHNRGKIVPRHELIREVWGLHADLKSRSIDQYMVNIRAILGQHGADPERLRTVHSVGYVYD